MRVLVDTPLWSFAFRRKHAGAKAEEDALLAEWRLLVGEGRALLCAPVRMEVLSGIPDPAAFSHLRNRLRWFPDETLLTADYEEAARNWTLCRSSGVAASKTDILLCTMALRADLPIFTTDPDFHRYAHHLPIRLHRPR